MKNQSKRKKNKKKRKPKARKNFEDTVLLDSVREGNTENHLINMKIDGDYRRVMRFCRWTLYLYF